MIPAICWRARPTLAVMLGGSLPRFRNAENVEVSSQVTTKALPQRRPSRSGKARQEHF